MSTLRTWRAHELAGSAPLVWAGFHLWEQWAAFAGREGWAARIARTSQGGWAIALELAVGILPALVWMALDVGLRVRGEEPAPLRNAMAEDPESARRLGLLARVGAWVFLLFLLYHAGWLWLPKLTEGFEPLRSWAALRGALGTWPHAILHAVGLTALAVHAWASVTRLGIVFQLVDAKDARRALRLSAAILAVALLLLYAQLVGWHAAGRGLFG